MSFKKVKLIVLVLLVSLLPTGYLLYASTPDAFAHITLEVNPALVLTVDSENRIIGLELKEGEAQALFSGIEFTGMDLKQALELITGHLSNAGFLNDDSLVLLTVHPAKGVREESISDLSGQLEQIYSSVVEPLAVKPPVQIVVLDSGLYAAAQKSGVMPSDFVVLVDHGVPSATIAALMEINYSAGKSGQTPIGHDKKIFEAYMDLRAAGLTETEALEILTEASLLTQSAPKIYEIASGVVDLLEAGIPYPDALSVFALGQGLEPKVFRKEISTIISDLIDLREEGIYGETALAALSMAIAADKSLEEVSTIISAIIDLKESGMTGEEAITIVRQSILGDPTLKNLDDLLEELDLDDDEDYDDDDEEEYDDEYGDDDDDDDDDDKRGSQGQGQGQGQRKQNIDRDDDKYDYDDDDDDTDDQNDDDDEQDKNDQDDDDN
ncbi:MAG: hypothetical protein KGZ32_06085 [Dethiobacter sp.]|nr:hypothetical protein [Dethiobacter sp.]